MSVKYPDLSKISRSTRLTSNPALPSMRQPALFGGDSMPFVPVEDLTIEQLKELPRWAFRDDEWLELESEVKTHILLGGADPDPSLERVQFDEDDWDELPEDVQEYIYEHDEDSKARVKSLAELIAAIVTGNADEDNILLNSEHNIDHYMGDAEFLWNGYGDKVTEWADEEMGVGQYDPEQLEEAAVEYGLTHSNAEFSLTSGYNGDFSADQQGFYLDRYVLQAHLNDNQIEDMTDDEIKRALEHANYIDSNVSYEGLEVDDFRPLFDDDKWAEIQKENDYESHSIRIDWDWDGVWESIRDAMEWEPGAPVEQFVEHIPEDRVLASLELSDGVYNVIDLLPGELKRETKKMNHCVGSNQFGYANAIRSGRTRILSVRPAGGDSVWKRTFTLEVAVDPPDNVSNIKNLHAEGKLRRIVQMKGTRNRVPGFAKPGYGGGGHMNRATTDDFSNPDELSNMVAVVEELDFDPRDVPDLRPGLAASLTASRQRPRQNPPVYIEMPMQTFDMPIGEYE